MGRTRVYVAGPITKGPLEQNIKQATDAGMKLLKAGFSPMVPHLTCYFAGNEPEVLPHGTTHDDWYQIDLPWVAVSHAVLRLPGESIGADLETGLADKLGIPVYTDVDELIANPPPRGDHRFHGLLREMAVVHNNKAHDYGTNADLFANVRASEKWGIPAWVGAMIRACDKIQRLQTFVEKGTLKNEGVEDSLLDLSAYALISLVLFREQQEKAAA